MARQQAWRRDDWNVASHSKDGSKPLNFDRRANCTGWSTLIASHFEHEVPPCRTRLVCFDWNGAELQEIGYFRECYIVALKENQIGGSSTRINLKSRATNKADSARAETYLCPAKVRTLADVARHMANRFAQYSAFPDVARCKRQQRRDLRW